MINLLIHTSSIFFYLIPVALISGPFIPDLFLSLIGIFFIIIRKNKLIDEIKNNQFIKYFLIFWAYILIRSLFASDIFLSLESSLFYFRFGIFVLAITWLIKQNFINLKILTNIYFFILLFIAIDCIFQFIFGYNFIGIEKYNNRLTSFFDGYQGHYNNLVVGNYLARLLPISLALILLTIKLNSKNIIFFIIYLNIVSAAIFLSGERVTILNLFFLFISICIINFGFRKLFLINIIIILLAGSISLTFNNQLKNRIVFETIEQINPSSSDNFQIISSAHHPMIENALKNFKDNIIFGNGTKMFRKICKKYDQEKNSCNTHPHNTYAQLLTETGLIGFSFVFLFFLIISYKILRFLFLYYDKIICQNKASYFLLLILIFTNLFVYQPTMSFFHNWISIIYFLPLSIFFYLNENNKI